MEKKRKEYLLKTAEEHLKFSLIPFWERLKDEEYGGYYGYVSYDLKVDKKYSKGCILNSRILWFFSSAYIELHNEETVDRAEELLENAHHAYEFLIQQCTDQKVGGVYWSLRYDGEVEDETKHTYNQAFAIYALAAYYRATRKKEALKRAMDLYELIEERCQDGDGYGEAYNRYFQAASNEKLSENGVEAKRTMNTLLHVFEAYTELYRVSEDPRVKESLKYILNLFAEKMYNPRLKRQEVFFDHDYNSLLDLHSYGHDIETAWLIDWGCEVLDDESLSGKMTKITDALTKEVYDRAYVDHSLLNECENGVDDETRVWWVQAETVIGFLNGYLKDTAKVWYLQGAEDVLHYIMENMVDKRAGSEWFWCLDHDHQPIKGRPIVEPWKCPYHNGRMCLELIRRLKNVA